MKKKLGVLLIAIMLIGSGCNMGEGKKDNGINQSVEVFDDVQNQRGEDNSEKLFQDESMPNIVGNSFANLGYACLFGGRGDLERTGRVTGQGNELFFYELGSIYKIDESGKKIEICSASDASSINVIGDTLYYLEGTDVYSIKTDGTEKPHLLKGVMSPFIVYNNAIYYVSFSSMGGIVEEYYIAKYLIEGNEPQLVINMGDRKPTLAGINPVYDDAIIYYYQIEDYQNPDYRALYYARYSVVCENFSGERIYSGEYIAPDYGANNAILFTICAENYNYVIWHHNAEFHTPILSLNVLDCSQFKKLTYIEETGYYIPRNCYKNDLVVYTTVGLIRVSSEKIQSYDSDSDAIVGDVIIENEGVSICEVYVVGEYVYYTTDLYSQANLYRVKIDGTLMEDI